jgi:hypothetical protein
MEKRKSQTGFCGDTIPHPYIFVTLFGIRYSKTVIIRVAYVTSEDVYNTHEHITKTLNQQDSGAIENSLTITCIHGMNAIYDNTQNR